MNSNLFTEFNNLYFFKFVLFCKFAYTQSDAISIGFFNHAPLC